MTWEIRHADCIEAMREMDEASVDAIVCDPPYGLEFMGKDWDSFKVGRADRYAVGGELITHEQIEERRGKGGAGPSYVNRPAKRCGKCGKQAWSGSPCECDKPDWKLDNSPLYAFQNWATEWSREALRILKPGGYLLAFGGTRTYHRLACAIEDAGFEIRDSVIWLYGSGFPKSLDVSKAIDKAAGAEREIIGQTEHFSEGRKGGFGKATGNFHDDNWKPPQQSPAGLITAPATPEAQRWQGWGTALKPAHEPIVVARKPLAGTVAANVTEHGTGALNVDGCQIGTSKDVPASPRRAEQGPAYGDLSNDPGDGGGFDPNTGRWPANVVLSPEAAEELDRQSGERVSGSRAEGVRSGMGYRGADGDGGPAIEGSTGGASRFFYTAKASREERNAGLDGMPARKAADDGYGSIQEPKLDRATPRENWEPHRTANHHPTVKPIDLMRWLVRLVTPPGGSVLDPFAGSGTTGIAAHLEAFDYIGIEREPEYVEIARARLEWWSKIPPGTDVDAALGFSGRERRIVESGQASLLEEVA